MSRNLLLLVFLISIMACKTAGSSGERRESGNHLVNESSPYLLQHAFNPVDWYPWGEEALEKAVAENKLLVISIGYSSCHWCHVMEHESFEDSTVAALMNARFISVKVDREERPDIDKVYMDACQLVSGDGCGWPLNAFALPDGQPFWAGTYFPKEQWLEILKRFDELWSSEPESIKQYAEQLTEGVGQQLDFFESSSNASLSTQALSNITRKIISEVDFEKGGIKGSPKFPSPGTFHYLLSDSYYFNNNESVNAVLTTLEKLASGGIYDQLEGGFARYATDDAWLIPHFEKMLYDNAQLVSLYAEAYQKYPEQKRFAQLIRQTLDFVEHNWLTEEGAFFSSFDADSEGEEGKYYVWSLEELKKTIKDESEFAVFADYYNIEEGGNWEEGKNILHIQINIEEIAARNGLSLSVMEALIEKLHKQLLAERKKRVTPGLDDKVLTSWNAMMLSAYLHAYHALGEGHCLDVALRNAQFLKNTMMEKDGRLWRNYKDGKASINAFLDDYALLAQSFIDMYQATFDETWLADAALLVEYALAHFSDTENSLLFYTSDLDPPLVVRQKEVVDNVIPASNAVFATVLWQLGHFLYNKSYLERAESMVRQVQDAVLDNEQPRFFYKWAGLFQQMVFKPYEIAIVGENADALREKMMSHYLPQALFLGGKEEGSLKLLEGKYSEGETLIYVCRNKVCKMPVDNVEQALTLVPVVQ